MSKKVFMSLPCRLTEEEKISFGQNNAREVEVLMQTRQEKKTALSEFKMRIDESEAEIKRLSRIVAAGVEWREIECEKSLEFGTGKVTVKRLDTGEVVEVRAMTPEEEQLSIDLI